MDKEPVGERLVLQAMYHVYGGTDAASAFGPVYKSHFTDGSKMYIQFQNSEAGIVCKADSEEGFEIAGDDKKYYHAKAEIEGSAVVLKSDKVQKPLYARYCWTNYRKVTLFGANGIPVAPFRTSTEDGSKAVGSRNGLAQ